MKIQVDIQIKLLYEIIPLLFCFKPISPQSILLIKSIQTSEITILMKKDPKPECYCGNLEREHAN